jgi:hypothetical protein
LIVIVIVVGTTLYRIAVLVAAVRSEPTHTATMKRAVGARTFRCGRQGGIYFASWPLARVVVEDQFLQLQAPRLVDDVSEPPLDLSTPTDIAVRRFT